MGNESFAIQYLHTLLDAGHTIRTVMTRNEDVRAWAQDAGLTTRKAGADLAKKLFGLRI